MSNKKEVITVIVAHDGGILAAQHPEIGLWQMLDSLKQDDPVWEHGTGTILMQPFFEADLTLSKTPEGVTIKYFK